MKRLAIRGLAALLATPAVAAAQFRPFLVSLVDGVGWPRYYGWPGYGWPGLGGYSYPYTFGGMGYASWPGARLGFAYPYNSVTSTSFFAIPNVGMPWTSRGGLPARWSDAAGRRHNEGRSVVVRAGDHVDVSFVPPQG